MRRVIPIVILLCAAVAHADDAPPEPADDAAPGDDSMAKQKAKELIQEGDVKFAAGDTEGALAKYLAAHEAYPSPKIYYPLGKAEEKLGHLASALSHYEEFLAGAGKDAHKDMVKAVTRAVAKLRGKVAAVTITADTDDATVTVDGRPVGTTPLDKPVYVDPGKRVFAAEADGHSAARVEQEVTAGQALEVKLELPAVAVAKHPPPKVVVPPPKLDDTPAPVAEAPHRSRTGFWIGLTLTGAFTVTATITGLMAVGKHSDFEDTSKSLADRKSAQGSGKTLAVVTDVMLVGALASGAYTTWYYFARMRGHETAPAEPRVAPAVGWNTLGIAGRF